jgi:NADH-quinone oxidoreductase subunit B
VDLPVPRPWARADEGARPQVIRLGGDHMVLHIFDAGLACCAVEAAAALRRYRDHGLAAPAGVPPAAPASPVPPAECVSPAESFLPAGHVPPVGPALNVLVVAGTVTDKLAPLVRDAYHELPEPRRVVSFGACSNSGGPYWDSYCVTKGTDQFIPVDVYVPGCPPRPEALLHGLTVLA